METKKNRVINYFESPILFKIPDGKKFVKEVIYEGEFVHPENPNIMLEMTTERFKGWIKNFKAKVPDIVYVPLNHSDNPNDNTGFIEDMYIAPSEKHPGRMGLFAKFNIVLTEIADKIGKTILGCSIGAERYFSPEGQDMGECLSHIALTNEPYIPHLGEFTQMAFSKSSDVVVNNYVFKRDDQKNINKKSDLEDTNMADEKELLALKEKLLELERKAKESEEKAELARKEKELVEKKNVDLERVNFDREMASEVDKLISSKKVLPANREDVLSFAKSLSNKESAMKYFATMGKGADVVDTTTLTKDGGSSAVASNFAKPDRKELSEIFQAYLQRKISKEVAFEKCKEWEVRFTKAKGETNSVDSSIKFKRAKDW